jgi:1,4-alpha-glucan branching enzyme/maltooligosyltrehalose trehalohydrolase
MLFMGEEFAASTPFLFFCDFQGDLGRAVTQGRRGEFARLARFADPGSLAPIPDPNHEASFLRSRLDWDCLDLPARADWLAFYRNLLRLRREVLVPRLGSSGGTFGTFGTAGLRAQWRLDDGTRWMLLANLSGASVQVDPPEGRLLFATCSGAARGLMGPWTVAWTLGEAP